MAVRARQRRAGRVPVGVPTWSWVGMLVVAATVFYYLLGRRIAAPWILTDELIYSDMARSFAGTGHLFVRDQAWQNVPPLYPVLISPAYALFSAVPDAYGAAKLINALAMPLSAVPLYFLARRVLSRPFALAGAALGVLVPSMLYTGTLMTENAFYPLFCCAALALMLVLERPTVVRSGALLTVCGVAFFVRPQGLIFLPVIVTAPLLLVLLRGSGLRSLRRFAPLYAVTAAVVVPPVLVQLARGHSVNSLFGRYSFVGEQHYSAWNVSRWLAYHVAELDLYVGVVPFAALLLLVVMARRLDARIQAFVAGAVALSFWVVLLAASYASALTFVHRVHERYMFYVASLLLIALLVWVEQGAPRPRPWALAAGGVAGLLPAILPLQWMLNVSIVSDTLALIPWWKIDTAIDSAAWTRVVLVAGCLGGGALFVLLPRRYRLAVPALVGAYLLAVMVLTDREWRRSSLGARGAVGNTQLDWIDRAVPAGARVAVLYTTHVPTLAIWETEFFNRAAGRVYRFDEHTPGDLPEAHATVSNGGYVGVPTESAVYTGYALSDFTSRPAGTLLGTGGELELYRTGGALHLRTRIRGLYPAEPWSGRRLTYARFGCTGGALVTTVSSDPSLFISRKSVVTRTNPPGDVTRTFVPPDRPVTLTVPLARKGPACRVIFTVSPAPALSIPAGTPPRPFGLKFAFP